MALAAQPFNHNLLSALPHNPSMPLSSSGTRRAMDISDGTTAPEPPMPREDETGGGAMAASLPLLARLPSRVAETIDGVWTACFSFLPIELAEEEHQRLVIGDKVMLPAEALTDFLGALAAQDPSRCEPPTPMCTRLTIGDVSHVCGVCDWSAPAESIIMPAALVKSLTDKLGHALDFGDAVLVSSADVPRAACITLLPKTEALREMSKDDQTVLLQSSIERVFTTLTVGDELDCGGCTFELTAVSPVVGLDGAVCLVDAQNEVLEVEFHIEEPRARTQAREAFCEARASYREALDASSPAALATDETLRALLRAMIAAADAAAAAGCVFGNELRIAREGLDAAEKAAEKIREEEAVAAQARAANAAAFERVKAERAAAAQAVAVAKREARIMRERFLEMVPSEPAAETTGMEIAVRTPTGAKLQRRFAAGTTVGELRAWVLCSYPAEASTPLAEGYGLRTQPPGPPIDLGHDKAGLTLEAAGLHAKVTLIIR